ncbi:MAG: DUF2520 domain-containing protein [Pyrinomonadaceae bacterium]|nr:DUF2520 domain-containing protein [Pyrinomonadaceae bacterium]
MSFLSISIVGAGKLGGALAIALSRKGYKIRQLVSRDFEKANKIANLIDSSPRILNENQLEKVDSDVVLITVQDSEIRSVSDNLAERLDHLPFVFHTSGAISSKELFRLSDEGCDVASLHPLISVSDPVVGANKFKGAYFCLEGDSEAVSTGRQIVSDLEGNSFSILTKNKTLYHAAAVTACGHLVALISTAIEMLSHCGLEPEIAKTILLPLIKSTVDNLEKQTPAGALTGTFARADFGTMQKHLAAIHEMESEEINKIYSHLGLRSLKLAEAQGANPEKLKLMQEILEKELLEKAFLQSSI